jgi:hypothetical protein
MLSNPRQGNVTLNNAALQDTGKLSFFALYWKGKGKAKAIPLQALAGPEGSRRLRLPDFKKSTHEGDKIVSPTHRPPLPPRNIPGTYFF